LAQTNPSSQGSCTPSAGADGPEIGDHVESTSGPLCPSWPGGHERQQPLRAHPGGRRHRGLRRPHPRRLGRARPARAHPGGGRALPRGAPRGGRGMPATSSATAPRPPDPTS
jgi:hypothetical protein